MPFTAYNKTRAQATSERQDCTAQGSSYQNQISGANWAVCVRQHNNFRGWLYGHECTKLRTTSNSQTPRIFRVSKVKKQIVGW
jgi:hypothetical protein